MFENTYLYRINWRIRYLDTISCYLAFLISFIQPCNSSNQNCTGCFNEIYHIQMLDFEKPKVLMLPCLLFHTNKKARKFHVIHCIIIMVA